MEPPYPAYTMDHHSLNEATQSALEAPSDQELRVPCYCEENVYRLVARKLAQPGSERSSTAGGSYYVVFVSSRSQCVPMYRQLASTMPTSVCLWDYHVIVVHVADNGPLILDMDSRLPYPCTLEMYVRCTFPEEVPLIYAPLFRVVRAEVYLKHFSSDRSHMRKEDGTWMAAPPAYACIHAGTSTNLDQYRNMEWRESDQVDEHSLQTQFGVVFNQDQFLAYFLRGGKDAIQD